MDQNNEPLEHHFFSMPPEAFHGKIPYIVSDLICELRRRQWYKVEGIFRLNGSDKVIKEIVADIDKGPIADWSKYPSVHDLAVKCQNRNQLPHMKLMNVLLQLQKQQIRI